MTKRSGLVAVIVMSVLVAAATTTTAIAQSRPDCLTSEKPGLCFLDGEAMNWFNLCGTMVATAFSGDVNGSWALWTFSGDEGSGNFERYNGTNGQQFFHANVSDADLWVCPATSGGLDCLIQYIDTCVVPAGMLTGTGRINGTEVFGGGCRVSATGDGTVVNQSGQSFQVGFLWILKPSPQATGECVEVKHELSITPE